MNRFLALIFSIIGVAMLVCISLSITLRSPWLALLSAVAAIAVITTGFVIKARARTKENPSSQ